MPPKKIGIVWVKDYLGSQPYLQNSGFNAEGLLNRLIPAPRPADFGFERGDSAARAIQLQQNSNPPVPLTQRTPETDMVEQVDMLYFSGHGAEDRLMFGSNLPDNKVAMNDEMELGEAGRTKWLIADACRLLSTANGNVRLRWGKIFHGLRYLIGFHGDCTDVHNRGEFFAFHLQQGDTIRHAWELACEESETNDRTKPNKYTTWAYLRIGDGQSDVQHDRWTDTVFMTPTDDPRRFTYVRNIPPPPSA